MDWQRIIIKWPHQSCQTHQWQKTLWLADCTAIAEKAEEEHQTSDGDEQVDALVDQCWLSEALQCERKCEIKWMVEWVEYKSLKKSRILGRWTSLSYCFSHQLLKSLFPHFLNNRERNNITIKKITSWINTFSAMLCLCCSDDTYRQQWKRKFLFFFAPNNDKTADIQAMHE